MCVFRAAAAATILSQCSNEPYTECVCIPAAVYIIILLYRCGLHRIEYYISREQQAHSSIVAASCSGALLNMFLLFIF